jgi:L-lactate dehydrogenase complex protein LldG
MDSKSHIVNALRRHPVPEIELPALDGPWLTFDRPQEKLREVLQDVGGQMFAVPHEGDLPQLLAQLPSFRAAQHVWSLVPAVASAGRDWNAVTDPHELEVLDYGVIPGEFGVAENAAVWITQQTVPHRAALVIAQHLVLVVPAHEIVHNMHEAYARIGPGQVPFGIFISGPSKTADIEQSLVIGAHGARSLSVVLVGPAGKGMRA